MRGRKPDAAGLQEVKANPGRRKSALMKRTEEAERVAKLLAEAPASGDPLAPPPIIAGGAAAVAVWRDLAPRLRSTHRLQPHHRPIFALFCVYFAEWVTANEDIVLKGHVQRVKTVAGGMMERTRPMVQIRDRALVQVLNLSERFGLTPTDEYALFRDQAVAAAQNPGLFDRDQTTPRGEAPVQQELAEVVGSLSSMDSAPPSRLN